MWGRSFKEIAPVLPVAREPEPWGRNLPQKVGGKMGIPQWVGWGGLGIGTCLALGGTFIPILGVVPMVVGGILVFGGGIVLGIGDKLRGHLGNDVVIDEQETPQVESTFWIANSVVSLQRDFRKLKALNELNRTVELVNAYNLTAQEISRIKESNVSSFGVTTQIEPLATDVFRQGLLFLCSVRDFLSLIKAEDEGKLQGIVMSLNDEIEELSKSGSALAAQTLELKFSSLRYTQDRILNLSTNREYVALLVARVEECENILRVTFDNLTKLNIEDSASSVDEIRHRLQNCINFAIEVRKEINKACLEVS